MRTCSLAVGRRLKGVTATTPGYTAGVVGGGMRGGGETFFDIVHRVQKKREQIGSLVEEYLMIAELAVQVEGGDETFDCESTGYTQEYLEIWGYTVMSGDCEYKTCMEILIQPLGAEATCFACNLSHTHIAV